MAQGIGIAAGHEERLVPGNAGCDSFFSVLSLERMPLHRLDGPLTPEALQELELLLLGAPEFDLERDEALAVWDWVESGGSLLLVLGEEPPRPVFSTLLEGVRRKPASTTNRWNLVLEAPSDASKLAGQGNRFVHWRRGKGAICVVASFRLLLDPEQAPDDDVVSLMCELVSRWRHRAAPAEVARRRTLPQRHRLLQGYPMAHHLRQLNSGESVDRIFNILETAVRPCIVGVLPHPFCNPAVKGCGFCTFPQESYRNSTAEQVVAEVVREVSAWKWNKPVEALYFGGGTANLTPPEPFRALCRAGWAPSGARIRRCWPRCHPMTWRAPTGWRCGSDCWSGASCRRRSPTSSARRCEALRVLRRHHRGHAGLAAGADHARPGPARSPARRLPWRQGAAQL